MYATSPKIVRTAAVLAAWATCLMAATGSSAADPKGRALCLGLNKVSPTHYAGWDGELFACEADARDMTTLATSHGFEATTLLTTDAGRDAVLNAIAAAASALESGDIFMLSYSGHGGQVFDENGDEKSNGANDLIDETWCLFDGQMLDDELYSAFRKFKSGVRILLISDSCHSGTVAKVRFYTQFAQLSDRAMPRLGSVFVDNVSSVDFDLGSFFIDFDLNPRSSLGVRSAPVGPPPFRAMPLDVARRTWATNRDFYKGLGTSTALGDANFAERGDDGEIAAHGILLSGCQDNQLSKDGWLNGAFTGALKQVHSSAIPAELKNYKSFHSAIVNRFQNDPSQTPNYYLFGTSSTVFETQSPFTIR